MRHCFFSASKETSNKLLLSARLDLLSFVGRKITEVIVGKLHLQFVAEVA